MIFLERLVAMRAVFISYVVFIFVGLMYMAAVGLLGR
jgi:hypothetical protein